MQSIANLSVAQLRRAAAIKGEIEKLERQLSEILGSPNVSKAAPLKGRRTLSAAARAKISAAQKKRWAKQKAAKK